jgi:hypothetical protein
MPIPEQLMSFFWLIGVCLVLGGVAGALASRGASRSKWLKVARAPAYPPGPVWQGDPSLPVTLTIGDYSLSPPEGGPRSGPLHAHRVCEFSPRRAYGMLSAAPRLGL